MHKDKKYLQRKNTCWKWGEKTFWMPQLMDVFAACAVYFKLISIPLWKGEDWRGKQYAPHSFRETRTNALQVCDSADKWGCTLHCMCVRTHSVIVSPRGCPFKCFWDIELTRRTARVTLTFDLWPPKSYGFIFVSQYMFKQWFNETIFTAIYCTF